MSGDHSTATTRRTLVTAALLVTGIAALVPVGGQIYGDVYPSTTSLVIPEEP